MRTRDADERVSLLGQLDLGAAVEVMTGETLWSIQRQIGTALSRRRAKVAVPSCNASGKTYTAARLALAFYKAFTPGVPCIECDPTGTQGGCRGSKVITTSSKYEHLRDNLWGEIRAAYPKIIDRGISLPGDLKPADLRLVENESNHYIIGQSAASAEGLQGAHAAHKLIIGDEATSVDPEVALAIQRLLASSDSRILLIYNPTTPDTYASRMARSGNFERIKITAFDTPAFTGEPVPPGSNLITPEFLEDLKKQGMGPGTFEWQTSIEAEDWDLGDDLLIPSGWYDLAAAGKVPILGTGTRQLGVDIAAYGSDENTIAVRDGKQLIELRAFPSMRTDSYVQGPVTSAVMEYQPDVVVFDADGVGAGAVGYFDDLTKLMRPGAQVIGFRGGKGVAARYLNQRSAWYWNLRKKFQNQSIDIAIRDEKLQAQLTDIHYTVTPQGDIRVETKQEMRRRGLSSPDRADALMYAFAFADDLPAADAVGPRQSVAERMGLSDHSEAAMWRRMIERYPKRSVNPVLGVPDDW
jgi:hypothetical protein